MWRLAPRVARLVPLLRRLRPERAVNPRGAAWLRPPGCDGTPESVSGQGGSKVPQSPSWQPIEDNQLPEAKKLQVSMEMIDHLERLALVDFRNQEGVERLVNAIQFANQLHVVDTEGVEPMDSVLEDRPLYLRADEVTDGYCAEVILSNAKHVIEEYIVAPPGNIPLPKKEERDTFLQHSNW
uniref:glutamyl-tRNA(Gln) amidotransferase subunit C, mitochondrial n=1 Tax=Pristiophorus japonicus TaxID=55135 RepID=UPI00398E5749